MPAGAAAAALGAASVRGPAGAGDRARDRRAERRHPAPRPGHRRHARASSPCSACCPRLPRFATATSPPITASSTRRSAPTSAAARPARAPEGARSLRLQPDRAAARALGCRPADHSSGCSTGPGPVARALAGAGGVSGAVELFAYAERHPDSAVGRAVHGIGHEIQRLFSTREPTRRAARGRLAALQEILRVEGAMGASIQPATGLPIPCKTTSSEYP